MPHDPVAVTRLVSALRQSADQIRTRAMRVSAGGRAMRWQSLAAGRFHDRLDALVAGLLDCAADFDHAADAVLMLAASA